MNERDTQPIETQKLSRRQFLGRLFGLEGTEGKTSVKKTLRDSLVIAAVINTILSIERGVQNPLDEKKFKTPTTEELVDTVISSTIETPIKEETLFRAFPVILLTILGETTGMAWKRGISLSALFAIWHDGSFKNGHFQNNLRLESLPKYQFLGGIFLWKLARERGYLHAILGHAVINASFLALDPYWRNYPE